MILEMLVGAVLVIVGYALSEFTRRTAKPTPTQDDMTIRHAKSSLRNPLKTFEVEYNKYKSTCGLYEPQKPKRE